MASDRLDTLLSEIVKWSPLRQEVMQVYTNLSEQQQYELLSKPSTLLTLLNLLRWPTISIKTVETGIAWLLEELRSQYIRLHPTLTEEQCKAAFEKLIEALFNQVKSSTTFTDLEPSMQKNYTEVLSLSQGRFLSYWLERLLESAKSRNP